MTAFSIMVLSRNNKNSKISITPLGMMKFSIMNLTIMVSRIMRLSIKKFSIMTFR